MEFKNDPKENVTPSATKLIKKAAPTTTHLYKKHKKKVFFKSKINGDN
jgi:hypothetical protein